MVRCGDRETVVRCGDKEIVVRCGDRETVSYGEVWRQGDCGELW